LLIFIDRFLYVLTVASCYWEVIELAGNRK